MRGLRLFITLVSAICVMRHGLLPQCGYDGCSVIPKPRVVNNVYFLCYVNIGALLKERMAALQVATLSSIAVFVM